MVFDVLARENVGAGDFKPALAIYGNEGLVRAFGAIRGEIVPESVDQPSGGTTGFVQIDDVVIRLLGVFSFSGAGNSSDEVCGVADVAAEGFVEVFVLHFHGVGRLVMASAVKIADLLFAKKGVVFWADAEIFGDFFGRVGLFLQEFGDGMAEVLLELVRDVERL